MSDPALQLLHTVFGYMHFRGDQVAVIETILAGHDALMPMPTGGIATVVASLPTTSIGAS